ncbi:geobacillin-26 family protein [Fusibacter ferrireducens]|uniref:Geobacillin-26 family protein n=1 Tax=Fusibacter ferrireducens TaxID=2785058 RepID=A0ABR9ZTA3_9FIRM|nr:geobacillin-26 family protein [Fusibacter ferrireducens]MBF4693105.1 geobacillin-26 family protein [Fusibacter ferrireducens]
MVRAKYANESNPGGYYFKTKQTTTNANNLDEFRKTVNSISSAESELIALVGTSTFFAGFATGFAVGSCGTGFGVSLAAYIAAAGFGLTAQQKSNYIGELQDTTLSRYIDIKNQSSIYI